jgi:thiaminase/transcriptional activator TenA
MTSLFDILKAACADEWDAYVDHAFVRALGEGKLSEAAFRRYLGQDYLFLVHFARAYGSPLSRARASRTSARRRGDWTP